MADQGFKRKLAAILSADVEGYSRLMDDDEEATVRTLTSYRTAIADLVQQFRGRIIDTPGDNILTDFTSVVDAVNCAVEIQRDLAERNTELPYNRQMKFRIGVNLGDVIDEDGRIYGDGVNIAARVESLADAGGICISGRAHDQVENKLGLEYEDLGKHEVKNISRPIQVYRVLSYPGAAAHRVVQAKETLGRRWRKIGLLATVVILIAVAFLVWQFYMGRPAVEPASVEKMAYPLPEKPSIAVLSFDNMSGDQAQEYIADGLSENIISSLSKIPDMVVIARNSSFVYKGKVVKVNQVAEELGIRYVLEGSVQKSGDSLRVTAQLVDAIKGHHLWSEKYDRPTKDFFTVQDDITRNIVIALQVELTEGEQARIWHNTKNLEAWGYATKGIALFAQYTKEKNAKARELFKKAVELDPNYASAWVFLAWTHFIDFRFGFSESRGDSFKRCIEIAKKVTLLDDSQPEVHSVWNNVYLAQGQYDKAIAEGKKAIELGPSNATSNMLLAMTLHFAGKFEESIFYNKKAMRLNPYYGNWYTGILASSYSMAGEHEKAIAGYEKYIERAKSEGSQLTYVYFVHSLVGIGQIEEARAIATEQLKADPSFSLKKWQKSRFYKDPKDLDRILNAARKAGLPDEPPLPLPDKPSIAVLAFDNMSGDPKQEYFSDGITEEIITALSKIRHLFVIARTSSFKYKGEDVDLRTVGRELGVRYVLEGSVRIAEDKVRITAQLIDAKKNNHIWAERFDRDMEDIFTLQDEITIKIINALQVELTEGEHARLWRKGTNNLEAYLKSLRAREYYLTQTKEGNALARRFAEEAIALDPEYPPPYHVLSVTHFYDVLFGTTKSPKQSMMKAVDLIQKTIALDDSYALAHGWLGFLYTIFGKYGKGIMEAQKGVALDPNGAHNYLYLSVTLRFAGRHEESVQAIEKAIRLNPFPPVTYYQHACMAYVFTKKYEEAIAVGKQAVKVSSPNDYGTRASLALAYSLAGREEEARSIAEEVLRINPKFSVQKGLRAVPYKNTADSDLIAGASRKAGLPE